MKRLLFISSLDLTNGLESTSGVSKKILLEITTFQELGITVDFVLRKRNNFFLRIEKEDIELFQARNKWYQNFDLICKQIKSLNNLPHYDLLYIRYENASNSLSKLIKHLKRENPHMRFVAEVPTVSKKWENGTSALGKIKFILKEAKKNFYGRLFDKIITFDNSKRLYGVKTVNIENFADVRSLPIRSYKLKTSEFNILAIALMTEAHGFDRIISGLVNYYDSKPSRKVYLTIIGEGPAKQRLTKLVQKYGLSSFVKFEGLKTTEEISDYIDSSDVASGSLAIFRKNCIKASELKIREYCARCIPFFYSAYEPILVGQNWCLKVPHDDTPINISQIIEFVESLDKDQTKQEMRTFSENFCTCKPQLQKVLNALC